MNQRRRHLVLLCLALAACRAPAKGEGTSNGGGPVGTMGRVGPVSSIMPRQEVAKIAGMPIADVRDGGDVCQYLSPNPEVGITIRVAQGKDGQQAWEQAKAAAIAYRMMPHAPVAPPAAPAAADEAMYGIHDSLAVRKGDVFIGVIPPPARVTNANDPPQLLSDDERFRIANDLAARVLQQLPR